MTIEATHCQQRGTGLRQTPDGLVWAGHRLGDLAQRYGTPLYVINPRCLEASYETFIEAFRAESIDLDVFFSVKTNPVADVLRVLFEQGAGMEIIAQHEWRLARDLGVPGARIVVNGIIKPKTLLEAAVADEAALINVASLEELLRLREIATRLGNTPRVGLRVNPALRRRRLDLTATTGTADSPLGLSPDSDAWHAALDLLAETPALQLHGLHCHIGSGIHTIAPYQEALKTLLRTWVDVWRRGFRPEVLDLGGGFGVPSIKELSLWELARLYGWNKPPRPPEPRDPADLLRAFARTCRTQLEALQRQERLPAPRIYLEPGRALSATAQLLLLHIEAVTKRTRGPACALCDGGAMSLSSLLVTEHHTVLLASREMRGPRQTYDVLGNLPTPHDVVALRRELPVLVPGDVLAVLDTGAYFTALGNTFAGPRPAIVMLNADGPHLIRRRESYADLFARDVHATPIGPTDTEN